MNIDICNTDNGKHEWSLQYNLIHRSVIGSLADVIIWLECACCGIESLDQEAIEDFLNEKLQSDYLENKFIDTFEPCTCRTKMTADGVDEDTCPACKQDQEEIPF